MGEPCAVVIALVGNEHLCLLLQPAEGVGMDDAVAIALEIRPRGARRLISSNWLPMRGRPGLL
jgi:hypothetical protein